MIGYRADIDGIRTIAVLSVILFHFGVPGFTGGFIGVDVFFVISGFLIGRAILDGVATETFSLVNFFERRVRRLYPALFSVMLVSVVVFPFILLPADLRALGKSIIATALYSSNILFYSESGYFDAGAINKPLLHTWSLAVEEQFYILFPLFALVLHKGGLRRRGLEAALYVGSCLSFALACWQVHANADAAFFLFPARAWEMGIGVMASSPVWFERMRRCVWAPYAGVLLILIPLLTYEEAMPFPGVLALPPCLGTALLIISGSARESVVRGILATKLMVFIGLISYSLYLWHWPIVVALSYITAGSPSEFEILGGIALTFVLAILSWRFVERPFRGGGTLARGHLFATAGFLSVGLMSAGLMFYRTNGLPSRFTPIERQIAISAGDFLQSGGVCDVEQLDLTPGLHLCHIGDLAKKPDFLVWGDSHARAWRDGINSRAIELRRSGWLVWQGGCPPLFGVKKREAVSTPTFDEQCYQSTMKLRDFLRSESGLRDVLMIGRWSYYVEGRGLGVDSDNRIEMVSANGRPATGRVLFAEALGETIKELEAQGRRVTVVTGTPEFETFNARRYAQRVLAARERESLVADEMGVVSRLNILSRQEQANGAIAVALAGSRAATISGLEPFCDRALCYAIFDRVPVFFDNNHLTVQGSIRSRRLFDEFFKGKGQ